MIYFTADTHFCHAKVIDMCKRPFENIEEMTETLIERWNDRVKVNDDIYILGDFIHRGNGIDANEILCRLNGRKYLIKGNHDEFLKEKAFNNSLLEFVKDYHVLKYHKKKFVLFHYPILEWDGFFRDSVHLYGHLHNHTKSHHQRAINVGVDVQDFRPVSIDEVIEMQLNMVVGD